MASRTKRLTKKEHLFFEGEVEKLAQKIADAKEYVTWARVELEHLTFRARNNRTRLRSLRVGALGMEDANERSKTNAEITAIEREVNDTLFKLAEKRSNIRRHATMIAECEEKLQEARKMLDA